MSSFKYVHMHLMLTFAGCATVPTTAAPFKSASVLEVREGDVEFRDVKVRGGALEVARIHYSTAGTPKRDAGGNVTNAVLMLHWTGSSGDVLQSKAFAEALYAPGRPLDLSKYFVVFVDALGHGRSSKPSDGLHARFPSYGYEDLVTLQYRTVTEALGIKHLRAIIGLSMGGMNAWQWAERYPDFMDAIVPIVALPARISGRNLVWRRFVIQQIRRDPDWKGGEYASAPRGWVEAFPVFRMMLDGVPHLHQTVTNPDAADTFVREASTQAAKMDANDILYSLEASSDYDPSAGLEQIRTRVFALNFGDDEFNPASLGVLETSLPRVPHGRFVVQPGTPSSFGHFTQAHPELWAQRIADFLGELDKEKP